ncbi:MAG: GNAT family N-acetyltransferase [Pseudomonadota bacterium]
MTKDYSIRILDKIEFEQFFEEHKELLAEDVHAYSDKDMHSIIGCSNADTATENTIDVYELRLGAFNHNNEFVGWTWGRQENATTFYMINSAVLKEYRGKGIYHALLNHCVEEVSKKGFDLIYSRHCATNNAIIIPKLKAGFIISKMEISDKYGVLIHLHYYTNELRKKIMDYRSGQSKPNDIMKSLFKI